MIAGAFFPASGEDEEDSGRQWPDHPDGENTSFLGGDLGPYTISISALLFIGSGHILDCGL